MKIVAATYGSRGDVQPIISLCLSLQSAGHDLLLAAPPENREWVLSCGLPFAGLGDPFMAFAQRHPDVHNPVAAGPFFGFLRAQACRQFEQLPKILRGSDLVLGCSLAFALSSAAEAALVPYRYIVFCPQVFRSDDHPSLFMRNHRMPTVLNRLSWKIDETADRLFFRPVLDRGRKKLGLPPLATGTLEHLLGDGPLLAAEKILAPLPADVEIRPERIGYPHLAGDGRLGSSLAAFLAEGAPPVYFGFGSMPFADPQETLFRIRAAAKRVGMRLVVSWGREERIGDDCFLIGPADHEQLFPRTAMVIHHGGAGTTTTAARAGVPQVLVPHVLDQFYWARRIEDLGLGPPSLNRGRFRVREISDRIKNVSEDPCFKQRAAAVAQKIGSGSIAARRLLRVLS